MLLATKQGYASNWGTKGQKEKGVLIRAALSFSSTSGALKAETLQNPISLDSELATVLLDWRGKCPYNQSADYKFVSVDKHRQTLWTSSAMSKQVLDCKVGRVAQLAEQCPFKAWVDGSSPSALTKVIRGPSAALGISARGSDAA